MTQTGYTTAREHAIRASELLNGVDHLDDRLQNMSEDERLRVYIAGGNAKANAQMTFWRDLALAHAQTALALAATEDPQ
jgi:hypothetical protein